jgi:hypothetical protein
LYTRPSTNEVTVPASAEDLARAYIWWEAPAEALKSPARLLRQILKLGTAQDYLAACGIWGEAAMREALTSAPPGALDPRSWHFWHLRYGLPEPPLPRRRIP